MTMRISSVLLAVALLPSLGACNNDPYVNYEPPVIPEVEEAHTVLSDFDSVLLPFHTNDALTYTVEQSTNDDGSVNRYGKVVSAGGEWELLYSDVLDQPIDFSNGGYRFTMRCCSPKVGGKIYFKLEGDGVPAQEVTDVVSTVAGKWETLSYDFSGRDLPDGKYNKIVLIFDAGSTGSGETWLFDDIRQILPTETSLRPGQTMYVDFDNVDLLQLAVANSTAKDMLMEVADNPAPSATNSSAKVGKVTTGSEQWELLLSQNLELPFCFSRNGAVFTIKVLAPANDQPIYFKVEGSDGSAPVEIQNVKSRNAGHWETYTFDFSKYNLPDNHYDRVVILFNAGNVQAGDIWYFDDIIGPAGDIIPEPTPEPAPEGALKMFCDFESSVVYFNINDSDLPMAYEIINNPFKEGINTSDHVGHVTSGGHQWELLWSTPLDNPLMFSQGAVFKMKVRSPKAGGKVYFKLEGDGVGAQEITNVTVPNANEWTELTYDFSSRNLPDGQYRKFVLLFDAGETGSGEDWYFDDIQGPDNAGALMVRCPSNPIFTYGPEMPLWRREHIANASLMLPNQSPDGQWRMYIRGSGYDANNEYHDAIGMFYQSASSFDPVKGWKEWLANPVAAHGAPGSIDELHLLDCSPVLAPDGSVYLYYQAVRGTLSDKHGCLAVRRSTDGGYTFGDSKMIAADGCGEVLLHQGKYYFFTGYHPGIRVMVSDTPDDLSNAVVYDDVLTLGSSATFDSRTLSNPHIFRLSGLDKWFMVYPASDRYFDYPWQMGVAYSDDLIHWTKVQNSRPFFTRGDPGAWDQGAIWWGEPFEYDGKVYMYYEGWGSIGLAPNRDDEYYSGGHSSTGLAFTSREAFLDYCGLTSSGL